MRRALCLLLLGALCACSRGGAFDLDAAVAHAAALERPLVLEFHGEGCEPCQRLERETLAAPAVREWLSAHVELERVDGDAQRDLVARLRVDGFPTLVFLAADGRELGRIAGFRAAQPFLAEAEAVLNGGDALSRARSRLQQHPDELAARLDLAAALSDAGRGDEALAELERCWERGAARARVEGALFLRDFEELAARHAPARAALAAHRDAERAALRGPAVPELRDVLLAARLELALDDPAGLLALYDELGARGAPARNARAALVPLLFDELLAARRYADLLANTDDVAASIEKRIAKLRKLEQPASSEYAARERERARTEIDRQGRGYFEALLGTGRKDEALRVARAWLGFAPQPAHLVELGELARRAGRAEDARALVLELLEGSALSESERASVRKDLDEHAR